MLKRFFQVLVTIMSATLMLSPVVALAQGTNTNASTPITAGLNTAAGGAGLTNPCRDQAINTCVATIIGNIIGVLLGFVEVILFLIFIYAGFLWMTAQDEKAVAKAKTMLFNAVAGLVIIGLSYLFTSFIITQFSQTVAPATTTGAAVNR